MVVAVGIDPVRVTGVVVGDHQLDASIVARLRLAAVDVHAPEFVVERLGPYVAQLEVPVVTLWRIEIDDQRLVGCQLPGAQPQPAEEVRVGEIGLAVAVEVNQFQRAVTEG